MQTSARTVELGTPPPTVLELLSPHHDVSTFDCGDQTKACPQINGFLRQEALHAQEHRENETYVLRYADEDRVRAYITLAAGSLPGHQLGEEWDIPMTCLHIAYVGRDKSIVRGGWGSHLVDWAIGRAVDQQGVRAIHLFAYEDMIAFYERRGFVSKGKPRNDEVGPKQLMIYDVLAALRQAEGKELAHLARVPLPRPAADTR